MPIQIKELIIRATVDNGNSNSKTASKGGGNSNTSRSESEEDKIVRRCVDEVMELLRIAQEP